MTHPPDQTRFYPPRLRLLALAVAMAVCAAIFLLPALSGAVVLIVIGWLGVVGLGLIAAVLAARALRPGPSVTVDADGITDRTSLAPIGMIRWDEITVMRKREIGRGRGAERLLDFKLTDPERFRDRPRSLPRRLLDRLLELRKQPEVSIPGSMVSVPLAEVAEAIRARRPQLQVLEGPPPLPPKFQFRRGGARERPHLTPPW